jgi:glycosyltransferase involved in cell wall biosynthesis
VSRTPRIVVNTAIYQHGTSGTATATRALVDALGHLADAEVRQVTPGPRRRSTLLNALSDARWDLWRASRAIPDVDLLVSPCNIGFRGRARRHLLVVHDVMAIEHPELFDRKFAAYFRLLVPRSVRSADRVLTLSDRTAEAVRRMDPGADVRVLAWAHPGGSVPRVAFPSQPVVLMVGATEPVKNQVAGIEAVARLRERTGRDVRLRLIGPAGRAEAGVRATLSAVDPDGYWSSREIDVPADVLEAAYGSSWLLLQPSHDEGFGLPLVEAARHGLPVVHSGRGAMPALVPEINAQSGSPAVMADAMVPLIDATRWQAAADTVATRARAYEPTEFRAAVRSAVSDLLPVPS